MKNVRSKFFATSVVAFSFLPSLMADNNLDWDIYSDTWVANDALGRVMPTYEEVGPVKTDQRRIVGIFYITWHTPDKLKGNGEYYADVTKILNEHPEARFDAKHPAWHSDKYRSYHWGEPEMGYFSSRDEWVIRKDISMLTDAGVDVLVMDVTNAVRYWEEWDVLFKVIKDMKEEGNKVPSFCFWAYNGPVITVVQELYERVYKAGKYKDLWFYWDGKPLLLYNSNPTVAAVVRKSPNLKYDPKAKTDPNHPHYNDKDYTSEYYEDYTDEVKNFFTLRTMWWGYYKWGGKRFVGTEDNWSFGYNLGDKDVKALTPEELASKHNGKIEQAAVTAAQHPVPMGGQPLGIGKSWSRNDGQPELDKYDMPKEAYVPWLGKKVSNPENYGIYFQERFDEMLKVNPQFLYINDWNEWTAGKQPKGMKWLGRDNDFYFVDQYNAEYNRCIQPMRGGYSDNYYMQMAQNIRKYKGVRPIPVNSELNSINMSYGFEQWNKIKTEYRDTKGDITHRDAVGYGNIRYVNNSGRNDIVVSKVAVDDTNIVFYAQTMEHLTYYGDKNWMLLFIDADNNPDTGWYGYDFVINKRVINGTKTTLMSFDSKKGEWKEVEELDMRIDDNMLMVSVPRKSLGLSNLKEFVFDFKWSDNVYELEDPISFCLNGDTAPNRRFNYRFKFRL